jgi:hypothetical protein
MAEVQNRTNRDLVSREKSARYVYKPSSALPDPTPEPGFTYRWIATHILGQSDPTNVSRKMRDGYEPVKAADHPELMISGNEKTGNVEIGGLMLCKIPTEKAEAMAEYFNNEAQNQMDSLDNSFLRQNDPRMPLFADRKSSVSRGGFGNGIK